MLNFWSLAFYTLWNLFSVLLFAITSSATEVFLAHTGALQVRLLLDYYQKGYFYAAATECADRLMQFICSDASRHNGNNDVNALLMSSVFNRRETHGELQSTGRMMRSRRMTRRETELQTVNYRLRRRGIFFTDWMQRPHENYTAVIPVIMHASISRTLYFAIFIGLHLQHITIEGRTGSRSLTQSLVSTKLLPD